MEAARATTTCCQTRAARAIPCGSKSFARSLRSIRPRMLAYACHSRQGMRRRRHWIDVTAVQSVLNR